MYISSEITYVRLLKSLNKSLKGYSFGLLYKYKMRYKIAKLFIKNCSLRVHLIENVISYINIIIMVFEDLNNNE